jgi:hypothetical protein
VIDLDQPPRSGPTGDGWRRRLRPRTLILLVVGSLLAGVVLGGVATHVVWVRPLTASADRAASAISLLIFAEHDTMTVTYDSGRARFETQVAVVNAGPATVNVLAVRVAAPGVTVRSPERERQVEPGAATRVDVTVDWACTGERLAVLDASIDVETAGEQLRTITPVPFDGTPWAAVRYESCG